MNLTRSMGFTGSSFTGYQDVEGTSGHAFDFSKQRLRVSAGLTCKETSLSRTAVFHVSCVSLRLKSSSFDLSQVRPCRDHVLSRLLCMTGFWRFHARLFESRPLPNCIAH